MALNTRSPRSGKIKIALLVTAFCIVTPILFYTHNLVNELQHKEREVARLYARSMEYLANSPYSGVDYSFVFNEMILAIDFPVIETDAHDTEIRAFRNVDIDSTLAPQNRDVILRRMVHEMDASNRPIIVTYQDTMVLSRVHYGESPLITRLRWLPYVEIIVGSLFVLVGYIGFSYIKRNEQSNIWVGMARETAHQLGTPLSSLMGWIEMLRLQSDGAPKVAETVGEMEHDLKRLSKIAERFSKIGSKPDLRNENLTAVIEGVISYFQKRLPQMGKRVTITVDPSVSTTVTINRELFEWVLENLVKNALDAMEDGNGKISFRVERSGNSVFIDVTDTGKGIETKYRKDIFRPGFTTKKRGWGLGLSLSKRIVESYHRGKLFVKESTPGHGTTFRIKLEAH
ncbi:MAG: HAMP domain-containing sensor histidine kinase [Ignavibacteriales bacterium]|nr:HAMP domain-containing sensor histidine kinase [Ignavibacteriales bacterium]